MKAIQLLGKEKIQLTDITKPEITEKEVLIKVKAASICGTDVRMYKNGYPTASEATPLTLGHEIAGCIAEVGSAVDFPVAGLVKNNKHKTSELLFGDALQPIQLERNSVEFFLLQRIQDEVHRFAITFHRQLRSKNSFSSRLDEIPGLGPKRKQQLMKTFKSLKNIQAASVAEIQQAGIPQAVAETILEKLSDQNKTTS